MSSRKPQQSLQDILDAVAMIEEFTAGISFEQFREEPMRVAAVERYLLKVSEAAIRLGPQAPALCPGLPWHDIRGIGNWLRHQYDRVDLSTVWYTATVELVPLKASAEAALQHFAVLPDLPGFE